MTSSVGLAKPVNLASLHKAFIEYGMSIPPWVFWKEWHKLGKPAFPVGPYCPRCGVFMEVGFAMHLCGDADKWLMDGVIENKGKTE